MINTIKKDLINEIENTDDLYFLKIIQDFILGYLDNKGDKERE